MGNPIAPVMANIFLCDLETKILDTYNPDFKPRVLFESRPALHFCNYKENKKNYTYVGYLFIGYFKDIMDQYFYY